MTSCPKQSAVYLNYKNEIQKLRIYLLVSWNLANSQPLWHHGSVYFQMDISLFITSFFNILIVYHREHVLIFSWHQKQLIYSYWVFGWWLFPWIKRTNSLHVLLLIPSDLNVLPSESRRRQVDGIGKKNPERPQLHFMLRTASLLRAVEKGNV